MPVRWHCLVLLELLYSPGGARFWLQVCHYAMTALAQHKARILWALSTGYLTWAHVPRGSCECVESWPSGLAHGHGGEVSFPMLLVSLVC